MPADLDSPIRILLICGSLRNGSTNEAVLRTAVSLVEAGAVTGVDLQLLGSIESAGGAGGAGGIASLPHFNPDDDFDPLPDSVDALRRSLATTDALLICTPEYAGALPGSFKNLLDWTVGGGEMSGKPVGWINASWAPTGAQGAHASLRTVLGYVDADIVEAAVSLIPVARPDIGPDGLVVPAASRQQIADTVEALADHVDRARRS